MDATDGMDAIASIMSTFLLGRACVMFAHDPYLGPAAEFSCGSVYDNSNACVCSDGVDFDVDDCDSCVFPL